MRKVTFNQISVQKNRMKCNSMHRFSSKWLNHFFTHIHDYDQDYSHDLLELLPNNLKHKGVL